jgi:hypothetical protein
VNQIGTRGAIFLADVPRLLMVIGGNLYRVDALGVATAIGAVANDGRLAILVYNQQNAQVGIASGGSIYNYNVDNGRPERGAPLRRVHAHCVRERVRVRVQSVDGDDGPVERQRSERLEPGDLLPARRLLRSGAVRVRRREQSVWTIGTETFEVRWNSGVGSQPWVPLQGLVGPWGIASPFGYGLSANGNFWITRNAQGLGRFVVSSGGAPNRSAPTRSTRRSTRSRRRRDR